MMRFSAIVVFAAFVLGLTPRQSMASLIGDEISLEWFFDVRGGSYDGPFTTIVTGDDSDSIDFFSFNDTKSFNVNPGSESILITFLSTPNSFSTSSFNGLVISDLDWVVGGPGSIVGVNAIDSEFTGFDPSTDLSFTADSVSIDFAGFFIPENAEATLLLELNVTHDAVVPEPASLAVWGGIAAVVAFGVRRKMPTG